MLQFLNIKISQISRLDWIKIVIIIFVSFSLITNFVPYTKGADDMVFALSSIDLAGGSFGLTNELLEKTGDTMFVPRQWVKTSFDSAIPIGSFGIYGIGAVSYLVGGLYGLFYVGPIITIFLIILSERMSTKFFGSLAGLVTLVVLVADWRIFSVGLRFLNDNLYAVFFLLGTFFLIKFFYNQNPKTILFCSIFFTIGTFFRISGSIIFPIEIFLVAGFFILAKFNYIRPPVYFSPNEQLIHTEVEPKAYILKINSKKILKIFLLMIIPWLVFGGFWLGYNQYFFGDPSTNYEVERKTYTVVDPNQTKSPTILAKDSTIEILTGSGDKPIKQVHESLRKGLLASLVTFDAERIKWVQFFSVPILPDTIKFGLQFMTQTYSDEEDRHTTDWMSILSLFILLTVVSVSILFRYKRTETIVFLILIFGIILFFSSSYIAPSQGVIPSGGLQDRYMIPVSLLSFMLLGFIVNTILKGKLNKFELRKSNFKILKGVFLAVIVVFFIGSFYIMPSVQAALQTNFSINNPKDFVSETHPDSEGLTENSVIVGDKGRVTVFYGFTHLYPYEGIKSRFIGTDPQLHPQEPIQMIKFLVEEGYGVFVFRKDMLPVDEKYFRLLDSEYGIILKNYSETFCKVQLVTQIDDFSRIGISDPDCFSDIDSSSKKAWDIRLKTPNELIS